MPPCRHPMLRDQGQWPKIVAEFHVVWWATWALRARLSSYWKMFVLLTLCNQHAAREEFVVRARLCVRTLKWKIRVRYRICDGMKSWAKSFWRLSPSFISCLTISTSHFPHDPYTCITSEKKPLITYTTPDRPTESASTFSKRAADAA